MLKNGVEMRYLLIMAITTTLLFAGCDKKASDDGKQLPAYQASASTGSAAPEFKLETTEGKTLKLSDYKGKVVIVDFWATWCPPCRRGIPDLIEIQKEYGSAVAVIGISVDQDTKNDVVPFMQKMGINYPVVYGDAQTAQAYGGIESIPTSFVIDQKGDIAANNVGLVSKSDLTQTIDKLLHK